MIATDYVNILRMPESMTVTLGVYSPVIMSIREGIAIAANEFK